MRTATVLAGSSARSAPVGSVMTRDVVAVAMDDSLATVREFFERHRFHHLMVLDRGCLMGLISDRDLLRALSPRLGTLSETERDLATLNKRAHQIMSRQVVTITAATSVAAASALMLDRKLSSFAVVGTDGKLEGIVTWRDLLRALLAQRVG